MNDITIVIGGGNCGTSPVLPYVGERYEGHKFAMLARLYLEAALLRCGFNIIDRQTPISEPQDIIMLCNRVTADGAIIMSYSAFGSRKSFNDVCGCTVKFARGRAASSSRILGEDVCAKLGNACKCDISHCDYGWNGCNCPTVIVCGGYLTSFDEARLVYDPDYAASVAEHTAMGVCEYYGLPYIPRDDTAAYPAIYDDAMGQHGKKIKMLQVLLCANGHCVEIDGVYGKATDLAVRTLHTCNNVSDSGVSSAIWRDLLNIEPPPLHIGSRHTAVLYLQRKLRSKLYKTPLDGLLDERTILSANEFITHSGSHCGLSPDKRQDVISREVIELLSQISGCRPRLF